MVDSSEHNEDQGKSSAWKWFEERFYTCLLPAGKIAEKAVWRSVFFDYNIAYWMLIQQKKSLLQSYYFLFLPAGFIVYIH